MVKNRYVVAFSFAGTQEEYIEMMKKLGEVDDETMILINGDGPIEDPGVLRRTFMSDVDELFDDTIIKSLNDRMQLPNVMPLSD